MTHPSAIYIPFELSHAMHRTSWQSVLVLVFNIALVLVLLARLMQRRKEEQISGLIPSKGAE